MKLSVIAITLLDEAWHVSTECQGHTAYTKNKALFVMPTPNGDILPEGTTNAVLKHLCQRAQPECWLTALTSTETIPVIFERNATTLWARIELPGLLLITRGCTADCLTERLRVLLTSLMASSQYRVEMQFRPAYDTSVVWELMQSFKTSRIAEQAGIDFQLLSQIMAGTAHTCPEQTKRLEASLRKLGKQLMQVALH